MHRLMNLSLRLDQPHFMNILDVQLLLILIPLQNSLRLAISTLMILSIFSGRKSIDCR